MVGAFTSTDQHQARRYSPWHRAFKTTAAAGGQQRWVYGSTAIALGQTIVDSIDATENDCRHKDSEAA